MKKIFTSFIALLLVISAYSQDVNYMTLFDFEDGVDTTIWIPFANGATGTKMDLAVVENPFKDNINSTDSVILQKVHMDADSWVGFFVDIDTLEIEGLYGAIEINQNQYMMSLMVNKPVSSPVRIKLERGLTDPGNWTYTVADTNTVVNQWEFLEFNFSAITDVDHYMRRLTIFTDQTNKNTRLSDITDCYVDNIGLQTESNTAIQEFDGAQMKLYPNPAEYRMAVVYPGLTGVRISNINGQEIRTLNFGPVNSKVIEVGDLTSGMYFVTALTAKGNHTMQFMKK